MKKKFRSIIPNLKTGKRNISKILKSEKIKLSNKIVFSTDKEVKKVVKKLKLRNSPRGFKHWQLPVTLGESLCFFTSATPKSSIPDHAHDGNSLRVVIGGSIIVNKKELKPGDWVYIPKSVSYKINSSELGAIVAYFHD